jgi:hypothetical protein
VEDNEGYEGRRREEKRREEKRRQKRNGRLERPTLVIEILRTIAVLLVISFRLLRLSYNESFKV